MGIKTFGSWGRKNSLKKRRYKKWMNKKNKNSKIF
jgi:hypothetical protein